jgi:hypothetical protein
MRPGPHLNACREGRIKFYNAAGEALGAIAVLELLFVIYNTHESAETDNHSCDFPPAEVEQHIGELGNTPHKKNVCSGFVEQTPSYRHTHTYFENFTLRIILASSS